MTLEAGAGNDNLTLNAGGVTVVGGLGNDSFTVSGAGGYNFRFGQGDGNDSLSNPGSNYIRSDILQLESLTADDVSLTRSADQLTVTITATGETFTVSSQFTGENQGDQYGLGAISFGDGTSWDRSDIRDHAWIVGTAGADTITLPAMSYKVRAGAGDDTLSVQGNGSGTVEFSKGDGHDVLSNPGSGYVRNDVLHLRDSDPSEVSIARVGDALTITIVATGDTFTAQKQFWTSSAEPTPNYGFNQIIFADGTIWNRSDLDVPAVPFTSGNDVINGTNDGETLRGGAGNDTINGNDGNDTIFGDGDNDTIDGGNGNDRIIGGTGNDLIYETGGDDTYVWNLGDGDDIIRGSGWWDGWNTVEFGPGIAPADLRFAYANNTNGMLITVAGQPGSLLLEDEIADYGDSGIDQVRFADDTLWTRKQLLEAFYAQTTTSGDDTIRIANVDDLTISAGAGNDIVNGGAGRDRILGGTGDDLINESSGDDTYVWNLGDGNDIVRGSGWWDGWNTVEFGAGIAPADLRFAYANNTNGMLITVAGQPGSLLLEDEIADYGDSGIDQVRFADGTLWTRKQLLEAFYAQTTTSGDDTVRIANIDDLTISAGAGNDIINGGAGRDRIIGGTGDDLINESSGDDTYVWNLGDGNDIVRGSGWWDGWNTVEFGAGIAPADLLFAYANNTNGMLITVAGQPGSLLLEDEIADYGDSGIDQVRFADGTLWTRKQLLEAFYAQTTTSGADTVRIANIDDLTISAGAGNDVINGGAGRDRIIGGTGDDLINESSGDDTYVWNIGDGNDTIQGMGWWDAYNTVELGSGITPAEVVISFNGNDVRITFDNFEGSLTIAGQRNSGDGVDRILFADGTVWDRAIYLANAISATPQNDILRGDGSANNLRGLEGNDQLTGLGGNDVLKGDSGNDTLVGDGYVATGSNLLVNGSFELLGPAPSYYGWGVASDAIPGWTKTNSGRFNQVYSGVDGSSATDGQFLMDLDDSGGAGSNMDIRQTISDLDAGQKLVLTFDHGNPRNSDSGYFAVYWNDVLVTTITALGAQMRTTVLDLIAIEGDNVIRFQGLGAEDAVGGQIDNVRLQAAAATSGNDILVGGAGDDLLFGGGGDDQLDGGLGTDIATYQGEQSSFTLSTSGGLVTVTDTAPTLDGDEGEDTLIGVETIQFKNGVQTNLAAPIILDLNGDGASLIDRSNSSARFDWTGDGLRDHTGWSSSEDGFLAIDRNGDGFISAAYELSFTSDKAGAKSDLDGLSIFDTDGDGMLSAGDARFEDFRIWQDANGDGVSTTEELKSLADAGIASISLTGNAVDAQWGWADNLTLNVGSFTWIDGSQGIFSDAALNYVDANHEEGPSHAGAAAGQLVEAINWCRGTATLDPTVHPAYRSNEELHFWTSRRGAA